MPYYYLLLAASALATGFALAAAAGAAALAHGKRLAGAPGSLAALRASMLATGAALLLGSLGVFLLVGYLLGASGSSLLYGSVALVALLSLGQWLFAPAAINAVYRTRPLRPDERWLAEEVERLARASGLEDAPKVVVAEVDAPNAFAYSSPLMGKYVAVTRGLLKIMPREEVVAVLGHEVGHLKHRDVAVILALSLLPAAMYYVGRMMLTWGWLFGRGSREGRGGNAALYYVGLGALLVLLGFAFNFMVMHFSRLREYYADAHSAAVTKSPRSLQRALARLVVSYELEPELSQSISKAACTLFIVNYLVEATGGFAYEPFELGWRRRREPRAWRGDIDKVVEELMKREESSLAEFFSTHPPVPKRLRFLESLRLSMEKGQGST